MDNIKAVIFDLDNTLLNRSKTFYSFTTSFVQLYFSHVKEKQLIIDRIIELDQDGYKDKRELFIELLDELPWKVTPKIQELLDYYAKYYIKNATLMDNAFDIIHYIKNTYKIGIITNGKTLIQHGKINQLGIGELFDFIIVSEEVGIKKPEAKIFEIALERLKIPANQCIYVGDHPINDIEGAGRVGMHTIWIKVNQSWNSGVTIKPNHRINHLIELKNIV